MEHAPSPSCPYLFRLHGDSSLCLPHASQPLPGTQSLAGSLPPLGLFLQPCLLPQASPEAASSSPSTVTSIFQLWQRLLGETIPHTLRLPQGTSPSILSLPQGLWASALSRWTHPHSQPPSHFLLSPVWQTGEKPELHGKQQQQLVPHTVPQAGAGPGVPAPGASGAARLRPLPGEAARAPAGPRPGRPHPVPPAPQGLPAEGPPGSGGEDGAPAAEAAARRAGELRGAGATAAGAGRHLRRPAPEDGGCQPLPEAPAGPGHPGLPPRRAGGAALREDLAPQPPAPGAAGPGEGGLRRGWRAGVRRGFGRERAGHTLMPSSARQEAGEGWPSGGGALPGCRWGADSLDRGVRMWSHPFLLGKEGREVAVFLVDTGDAMSPELSRETRTKLCALIMMLSSYQILNTSQELKDADLEYLEMFVHVAEVMGRHYGMVPIQHLDLLVRDSFHPNKAGQGPEGDTLQKSGKYPRVRELLRGKQARCCLLPALRRPCAGRDHGSPGSPEDDACPMRAYVADVLSAAPQHAKSRCQGYWSEGRPMARGDGRLLTGQQLAQEIKNLSGWMGRPGPGFASPDEMAAQLHDLRIVEAAKKEFKEYVRQQDVATKRIFSALRVLPDTMRNLLSAQKDAILAHHGAALRCQGRAQALEALEAELQTQARAFMDTYTMRFCGHLAAVGGAVGAGLMGLAGGVVGAGMAAAALAAEAGMVAAGAAVGATGAAVVGGGVGAGLAATLGCMEKEEEERLQEGDREPLLQGE